jgi:gliding motility-associated-like protein
MRLFYTIIPFVFLVVNAAFSQNNDCIDAVVICSSSQISFNPSGPGMDDFIDPDNDAGCLLAEEHQSAWYYFEFRDDMPPNSILEFTITPNAGSGEDYDFAIYGPNPYCDDLGEPIRCSFANSFCFYCPQTGLGNGAADFSENASGDGFVAPMIVQPGEGYYLLVDNYDNSSQGFDLDWSGGASAYLDCTATPECDIQLSQEGPLDLCPSAIDVPMPVSISGLEGDETYQWSATNGGEAFLSATNIAYPDLIIPNGTTGSFTYTLTVINSICAETIDITVNIIPSVPLSITGDSEACEGEEITLSVTGPFIAYDWSSGATSASIAVNTSGTYSVQATDAAGCEGNQTVEVIFHPLPEPEITGDDTICEGESSNFDAGSGYADYVWSNGSSLQSISGSISGSYSVTVTDTNGCEGSDAITLAVMPAPEVEISGETTLCKGEAIALTANPGMSAYSWNNGEENASITISAGGNYAVEVLDQNGCSGTANIFVQESDIEVDLEKQDPFCFGDINGFININDIKGGIPPYLISWQGDLYGNLQSLGPLGAGVYHFAVRDEAGCEFEQEIVINEGFDIFLDLGEDQTIHLGDAIAVNALTNVPESEILSLTWRPEEVIDCLGCLELDFQPLATTTITAFIEDIRGCQTEHEVTIIVDKKREVFIPNAFSPNDDGVNDELVIFAGKDVAQVKSFRIFNRWGSPVFEMTNFQPNDPAYGWRGKTTEMMNSNTFIYAAEIEFIDGVTKLFSGDFVLLR